MTFALLSVLGLFISVQLFYYLFYFSRLAWHDSEKDALNDSPLPVTVLVCAWNELENLKELLPILDEQDYSDYEVIVLDDRSTDGTKEWLEEQQLAWKHIRYIRIDQEFEHINPKKYAITVGVKHAKNSVILLTDADCRPATYGWIRSMAARTVFQKDIVLGFSPYYKAGGLLNWFIRCETFYTAVQYFSFSKAGVPYMGVGRNLLYKASVFFDNRGFYKHKHITGGDDDLFLNEVAKHYNTTINLDPDSFMYSLPKTSWGSWLKQKKRHLSVSKYYRWANKVRLGLLSFSHVMTWLVAIALVAYSVLTANEQLLIGVGAAMGGRWLVQFVLFYRINSRLGRTVEWGTFIFMDMALFFYYIFIGMFLSRTPKKKKLSWR